MSARSLSECFICNVGGVFMISSFYDSFVLFVSESVPYVITWEIGMLIVRSLVRVVTGRGLTF